LHLLFSYKDIWLKRESDIVDTSDQEVFILEDGILAFIVGRFGELGLKRRLRRMIVSSGCMSPVCLVP